MNTGKKTLAIMLMAVFMLLAGNGIARAAASAAELQAIIQADVNAGLSLDGAIRKAMAAPGANIESVLNAAIMAGVPIEHVIYTMAHQGYSFATIRQAALRTGASPSAIQRAMNATQMQTEIAAAEAAKFAAAVRRDLQSGMTLAEVMARARAAGKTASQIVNGAIMAGARADDVVYVAIQAGYPANDAISAALSTGAAMEDILPAALSAGASDADVMGAVGPARAQEAASIIARIRTGVFGYTPPSSADNTSRFTGRAGQYEGLSYTIRTIGGGGGGTASTRTASP